ncbi:MAG: glycosyltransferase family 9 protein [Candidatus Omnitrophica bacterium]|nr:glycosyltransferase family 9 protein [Candidatus Omnitrophota bacterium]
MFKNILIIGHSNIGDVCYNLTVIAPLESAFPAARISFLTSSRARELVENYPGIDRIITFDKHTEDKGIIGRLRLIKILRGERFDLAVVLKKSLFFVFARIPCVWRLKREDVYDSSGERLHIVLGYLNLLRSHGVSVKDKPEFNFKFRKQELDFADSFFKKNGIGNTDTLITISPLSNWSLKCWPIQKWKELMKALSSFNRVKVLILGKETDDPFSKKAAREISGLAISAINQCSLKMSMALIRMSKLFISSDSSLLHIASCMKIPSIGVYGPTATGSYYPFFHSQEVIIAKSLPPCAPCLSTKRFAQCRAKDAQAPCMQAISVVEVLETALEKLNLQKS